MLITPALMALAAPAVAQDYDPSMAAHESMSQQQFVTQESRISRNLYRNNARRSGGDARTAQTCANVPRVRARLGAGNPKVQELARLCRKAGY
jgi:hypothetical protein